MAFPESEPKEFSILLFQKVVSNGGDLSTLSVQELQGLHQMCSMEIKRRTQTLPIVFTPQTPHNEPLTLSPATKERILSIPDPDSFAFSLPKEWIYHLPSSDDIIQTLDKYEPVKYSIEEIYRHIEIFLSIINNVSNSLHPVIMGHFFRFVQVNISFVRKNKHFQQTLVNYIRKFRRDPTPEFRNIAEKYAWIETVAHGFPESRPKGFSVRLLKKAAQNNKTCEKEDEKDIEENTDYGILPQWDENSIGFKSISNFLNYFKPIKTSSSEVVRQLLILLKVCERSVKKEQKVLICKSLFQIVETNMWFMEEYKDFRTTLINKIHEFSRDCNAKEIAQEYMWMTQYPYSHCNYCGEIGKCPVRDTEIFCSIEHQELFSLNGDCAHDPKLTKEKLDSELNKYMSVKVVDFAYDITRANIKK
jgi:hypothetical protein